VIFRRTAVAGVDSKRILTMRTSLIAIAAAAFLASPALAEKNQATLSRAPVASNSTFVTRNGHVLGVDLDLTIRLGFAPDREAGY
jgi:hypothetical protein